MKLKVAITTGEDGWYVVECPALPGCVSQGKTIDEALENIKDAIQGYLAVRNEGVVEEAEQRVVEVTV